MGLIVDRAKVTKVIPLAHVAQESSGKSPVSIAVRFSFLSSIILLSASSNDALSLGFTDLPKSYPSYRIAQSSVSTPEAITAENNSAERFSINENRRELSKHARASFLSSK